MTFLNSFKSLFFINLIVGLLFLVDRLIKTTVLQKLSYPKRVFEWNQNPDFAFGFISQNKFWEGIVISLIVFLLLFLVKSYQNKNPFLIFGFSLILGGALSNFIDRLLFGLVIDYWNLSSLTTFNLADTMIGGGIGVVIISNYLISHPRGDHPKGEH